MSFTTVPLKLLVGAIDHSDLRGDDRTVKGRDNVVSRRKTDFQRRHLLLYLSVHHAGMKARQSFFFFLSLSMRIIQLKILQLIVKGILRKMNVSFFSWSCWFSRLFLKILERFVLALRFVCCAKLIFFFMQADEF